MVLCFVLLFFQAEDGIRDLVRSRGLGDVYKRQALCSDVDRILRQKGALLKQARGSLGSDVRTTLDAVSYTHLTLPTSDLV